MLNRRTFLRTGLTSGAAIPLTSTLNALAQASVPSLEATAAVGPEPLLVALPPRLAPIDPVHEPWQQKVRRVAQTNMTEHDPVVMNVEEWADYWHSADADVIFIRYPGILSVEGEVSSSWKVPERARFFWGMCRGREETRHACRRTYESRPQLG